MGATAVKEPDLFDVCAGRHRGNRESDSANKANARHRTQQRKLVHLFIQDRGQYGATTDEIAVAFKTTPNALSGRLTELKRDRLIEKRGTRPTRSGSPAGIHVAI